MGLYKKASVGVVGQEELKKKKEKKREKKREKIKKRSGVQK